MKQIICFFLLIHSMSSYSQGNSQNELRTVIYSMEKSNEFLNFMSQNKKQIIIKSINDSIIEATKENVLINDREIYYYKNISESELKNYTIISCKIYNSTYDIILNIVDLEKNTNNTKTIKLID